MELLRLTRHPTTITQENEIKKLWGDIDINNRDDILPSDPHKAVKEFDRIAKTATIAEVVLPINLIEAICKHSKFRKRHGILVRAVMTKSNAATFDFDHYELIESVSIKTRRL